MAWTLDAVDRPLRTLLMVSKEAHCLTDLLFRARQGRLPLDVAGVVSNHPDLEPIATFYGAPFHHVPVDRARKAAAEAELLDLVARHDVERVVLARAVRWHAEHRVFVNGGRTVVFR